MTMSLDIDMRGRHIKLEHDPCGERANQTLQLQLIRVVDQITPYKSHQDNLAGFQQHIF
jgi:hypothetical protein